MSTILSYYPIIIFIGLLGIVGWFRVQNYQKYRLAPPDYHMPFLLLQHPDEILFQQHIKHPSGSVIIVPLPLNGNKIIVGDCISLNPSVNYSSKNKIIRLKSSQDLMLDKTCENLYIKWFSKLREIIIDRYHRHVPFPNSAIVLGVTIGYKDELTPGLKNLIKVSGLSHILVVSGYNFSLLNSILRRVFSKAGIFVYLSMVIFIMSLYLILCGLNPPAIRAVIMIFMLCICNVIGRKSIGIYSLLLSYVILIIISPSLHNDISFNLSFFSTAGLLFSSSTKNITTSVVLRSLIEIIFINIFIFPLISFYFEKYYLWGILINILVLDLIPLLTIFGFINILLLDPVTYLKIQSILNIILDLMSYIDSFEHVYAGLSVSYIATVSFMIKYYSTLLLLFSLLYLYKWRFRVRLLR